MRWWYRLRLPPHHFRTFAARPALLSSAIVALGESDSVVFLGIDFTQLLGRLLSGQVSLWLSKHLEADLVSR